MTDRRPPAPGGLLASALGEPTASEMIRAGTVPLRNAGMGTDGAVNVAASVLLAALRALDGTELLDTVPLEERTDALAVHLGAALTRRIDAAEQRGRDSALSGQAPDGLWHYVVYFSYTSTPVDRRSGDGSIHVESPTPINTFTAHTALRHVIARNVTDIAVHRIEITGLMPLTGGR